MKIIETKVYTFEELSDTAKEKAREWWRQGNDMDFLPDFIQDELAILLEENKLKCEKPKIYYSLSYSQGDGAMFEGVATWQGYTATIKHSGHYYHYNSKNIELVNIETQVDAPEESLEAFNEIYIAICEKLARSGYSYIEAENSNENVDDNIIANKYTFTENGARFG